jgi:hypothetical protein
MVAMRMARCHTYFGDKTKRKVYWLLWAFLWIAASPVAFGQAKSGSIIVLGYSKDRVFIVADSRDTISSGKIDDQYCKVVALGNKLLFALTGISGYDSHTPLIETWGGVEEARKLFKAGHSNDIDTLSAYWGQSMLHHFTKLIKFDPQGLANNVTGAVPVFVLGVFAGANEVGNLAVRVVVARCKDGVPTPCSLETIKHGTAVPTLIQFSLEPTATMQLEPFGMLETFVEFNKPREKFSATESKQWVSIPERMNIKDRDMRRAMKFIDLTVAYHPKKELVGGDIDAVELTRDGKVRWISRKANCPAD